MTLPNDAMQQALANCAAEPIAYCASIQDHAALIVMTLDGTIENASINCPAFFNVAVESVVGLPLEQLIGSHNAVLFQPQKLKALFIGYAPGHALDFPLWLNNDEQKQKIAMRVYQQGLQIVAEFSKVNWNGHRHTNPNATRLYPSLFDDVLPIKQLNHYLQGIAEKLRELTEYDRVMVYRFKNNWDGEVVAESQINATQSFLGLHFPASDIPEQARRLYSHQHFNMLVDSKAASVAIEPAVDARNGQPLDLTYALCRSFSPVHRQYLHNMGVRASLSISIMVEGRLWGLVACHHNSPKQLPLISRKQALLISKAISHKVFELQCQEHRRILPRYDQLLAQIEQSTSKPLLTSELGQALLGFMQASGVLIGIAGRRYSLGAVPNAEQQAQLIHFLQQQPIADTWLSECLSSHDASLQTLSPMVCGALATPVNPDLPFYLIWLRSEFANEQLWGGQKQPDDLVLDDTLGYILRPRQSFAAWQTQQQLHCQPWDDYQKQYAPVIAAALFKTLRLAGY
jgi:light-regulated signal transduction histidine kinase (bacteriophytochrome)